MIKPWSQRGETVIDGEVVALDESGPT